MTSPDQIAAGVNAGQYNPDTPGLNAFTAAWGAWQDFVGNWSSREAIQIQNYGDVVAGVTVSGGVGPH